MSWFISNLVSAAKSDTPHSDRMASRADRCTLAM
jgi:hypothetical protein